jgi:hypothetical protein
MNPCWHFNLRRPCERMMDSANDAFFTAESPERGDVSTLLLARSAVVRSHWLVEQDPRADVKRCRKSALGK